MYEELVSTESRTITEADITFFSYFSGDWTYLHTDAVASKKSIFHERVAHGSLILSVSLGLLVRAGIINKETFIALKSIDTVKFLRPVKIGDTVHVVFNQSRKTMERGRKKKEEVNTRGRTLNQEGEIVMEFQATHLERSSR